MLGGVEGGISVGLGVDWRKSGWNKTESILRLR